MFDPCGLKKEQLAEWMGHDLSVDTDLYRVPGDVLNILASDQGFNTGPSFQWDMLSGLCRYIHVLNHVFK